MNLPLSKEERDRIARQYGATVPETVTVSKHKPGESTLYNDYYWCGKTNRILAREGFKEINRRMAEQSWSAAKRRFASERGNRRRRVRELHAQGYLNLQIAQALGISPATVGEDVRALGLEPNKKPNKSELEAEARKREAAIVTAKMRAMVAKGMYAPEIAVALGRTVQAVWGYAREYGVPLKRQPKALSRQPKSRKGMKQTANMTRAASARERAQPALAMLADGVGVCEVAARMGVAHGTVGKWVRKYG